MFESAHRCMDKAVFPGVFFHMEKQARRAAEEGRRGADRSGICQVINSCKPFSERMLVPESWAASRRGRQQECRLQALAREGTGGESRAARCCTDGVPQPMHPSESLC